MKKNIRVENEPIIDLSILHSACDSLFNKEQESSKEVTMVRIFEIFLLSIAMISLIIVMVFLTDTMIDRYRDSRACGSFTLEEFNKGNIPGRCLDYFNK